MFHFNLRQKMILCFCVHLTFYGVYGLTFLKDFNVFNEDVTLLMHAGNLSNICLEIRRYEKNFIIRHSQEDFAKVGEYIEKAQKYLPQVKNELTLIPHPLHLDDLQITLQEYKDTFASCLKECNAAHTTTFKLVGDLNCPSRMALENRGQELVDTSEQLVQYEQQKMTNFIDRFKQKLWQSIIMLIMLSIFTMFLLHNSIILPLRSIERAAAAIAAGTFRKLSIPQGKRDEVSSVLRAFNNMVNDLKKQQEQLFQAKKLSSIGTLASGTAHQINNPLNNIATSCQLAMTEVDEAKAPFVSKMLNTINQETQRAGEIVKGLLEFSRVHTFSMQPIALQIVVDKTMRLIASEIPSGVTVEQHIQPDIILLLDSQKMVEALLNLLINGIQAIQTPPGQVTISAEIVDKQAIITIKDTGCGIRNENLLKVFDPFFTTKQEGNGTGLGLAVVYGIIKKHKGTTKAESTLGEGTRFIITLPLCNKETEEITSSENKESIMESENNGT